MLEFIDSLATLLSASLGLILGCIAGLFISYVVYRSMIGSDLQDTLSAVAFFTSAIMGLVIETYFFGSKK